MKKYLLALSLTVLVSISLISCDLPSLYGYQGLEQVIYGHQYEFTSDSLIISEGNSLYCDIHTIYNSPMFEYEETDKYPYYRVQAIADGDTLIIYGYKYQFTDTEDKSTEWHENYFKHNYDKISEDNTYIFDKDSVLIIGPSEVQKYRMGLHYLELETVESLCP